MCCTSPRTPRRSRYRDTALPQLPGDPPLCLLSAPRPLSPQGVDGDASVHDRVLWALHISGMDDLLKFLASAQTEQQWALHVLEIISLMFRDQVSQARGRRGRDPPGSPQIPPQR